jgi:hypothetical protein
LSYPKVCVTSFRFPIWHRLLIVLGPSGKVKLAPKVRSTDAAKEVSLHPALARVHRVRRMPHARHSRYIYTLLISSLQNAKPVPKKAVTTAKSAAGKPKAVAAKTAKAAAGKKTVLAAKPKAKVAAKPKVKAAVTPKPKAAAAAGAATRKSTGGAAKKESATAKTPAKKATTTKKVATAKDKKTGGAKKTTSVKKGAVKKVCHRNSSSLYVACRLSRTV